MPDLLLEVVSEPMPGGLQGWVWKNLWKGLREVVKERGGYDIGEAREGERDLVSPYRVVLMVRDVPKVLPLREVERRGPREDAPQKALDGFFKSVGGKEDCQVEETPKGRFWFYRKKEGGGDMGEVLGEAIVEAIVGLKWPKVMRFGREEALWVRPLQRLVAVWEGKALAGGMDCKARAWKGTGEGESYLPYEETTWEDMLCVGVKDKPKEVRVGDVSDYEKMGVTLREGDRARAIENLCGDEGGEEVERWAKTCARLGERFSVVRCELKGEGGGLPWEVVKTALWEHMKVLVTEQGGGKIKFLVATEKRVDGAQDEDVIREGYCRVAVARLRDAEFFWEEDGKKKLEDRLVDLEKQIWHRELGSMGEKAKRLEGLAGDMMEMMRGNKKEVKLGKRAGLLSKSDLASLLVGEYPSLQGVIGGYYGEREGENMWVCEALSVQYKGADEVAKVGIVARGLYLADRLDTLYGMFHAGERPTGSRDPFALRRAGSQIMKALWLWESNIETRELVLKGVVQWEGDRGMRYYLSRYLWDRAKEVLSEKYESAFVEAVMKVRPDDTDHECFIMNCMASGCEALVKLDEKGVLEGIADMWNRVDGFVGKDGFLYKNLYRTGFGVFWEESLFPEPEGKAVVQAVQAVLSLKYSGIWFVEEVEETVAYGKKVFMIKEHLDRFCDNVRIHDSANEENHMTLLMKVQHVLWELCDGDPLVRMYSQRKSAG